MSDYIRATREATLDSLRPELTSALRSHLEKHEFGEFEPQVLICIETISTKKKKGLFGGKPEVILTGALVTPTWLVWAAGREGERLGMTAAKLREIQIQDYEKSDFYKLIPDSGLNISGLRTDSPETGGSFIGLGPEPAGQKFREVLREALAKA
jgi:hypothetical protein